MWRGRRVWGASNEWRTTSVARCCNEDYEKWARWEIQRRTKHWGCAKEKRRRSTTTVRMSLTKRSKERWTHNRWLRCNVSRVATMRVLIVTVTIAESSRSPTSAHFHMREHSKHFTCEQAAHDSHAKNWYMFYLCATAHGSQSKWFHVEMYQYFTRSGVRKNCPCAHQQTNVTWQATEFWNNSGPCTTVRFARNH